MRCGPTFSFAPEGFCNNLKEQKYLENMECLYAVCLGELGRECPCTENKCIRSLISVCFIMC